MSALRADAAAVKIALREMNSLQFIHQRFFPNWSETKALPLCLITGLRDLKQSQELGGAYVLYLLLSASDAGKDARARYSDGEDLKYRLNTVTKYPELLKPTAVAISDTLYVPCMSILTALFMRTVVRWFTKDVPVVCLTMLLK